MTTEAETGVMHLKTNKCDELLAATKLKPERTSEMREGPQKVWVGRCTASHGVLQQWSSCLRRCCLSVGASASFKGPWLLDQLYTWFNWFLLSSFFKESLSSWKKVSLSRNLSSQIPSGAFSSVRNMIVSLLMAQNLPQYGVRFSGVFPPRKADMGELPAGFHFFGCKGKSWEYTATVCLRWSKLWNKSLLFLETPQEF